MKQVESYCKDKGDNDTLLLQEKYEDEFSKFLKKTSIHEQKISSNQVGK